ncbi:MAG: hypothetical protein WC149_08630 [Arcobacteraceae bacterium]
MKLKANTITKITSGCFTDSYMMIENTNTTGSNVLYILDHEPYDPAEIIDNGIVIGGLGFFEIQKMSQIVASKPIYGYTTVSNLDIRVLRL